MCNGHYHRCSVLKTMEFRLLFLLAVINLATCEVVPLSCEQITELVDGHNKLRKMVASGDLEQPGAVSMNSLVWDDELADLAAGWAARNTFGHNPDRTLASKRFSVGENIYQYATSNLKEKLSVDKPLESWFDEYHDYKFGAMQDSDFSGIGPQTGHYTQMVWADTTHLGCALSESLEDEWKKFFVVCNYGPAGNYLGSTPYVRSPDGVDHLTCADDCSNAYGKNCS